MYKPDAKMKKLLRANDISTTAYIYPDGVVIKCGESHWYKGKMFYDEQHHIFPCEMSVWFRGPIGHNESFRGREGGAMEKHPVIVIEEFGPTCPLRLEDQVGELTPVHTLDEARTLAALVGYTVVWERCVTTDRWSVGRPVHVVAVDPCVYTDTELDDKIHECERCGVEAVCEPIPMMGYTKYLCEKCAAAAYQEGEAV